MQNAPMKIFSLTANLPLAEKISEYIGVPLGKMSSNTFSDGEIQINVEESVRGTEVYVIQSTNNSVNDHWMELLIMVDALKRASAKSINIVMPYYGYARQDRTAKPREPITAKLVANMLVKAGADRLLTLDLHTVQLQGFFDVPVDNLFTEPLFANDYLARGLCGDKVVVVAPKNSGVKKARTLAGYLDSPLAIVDDRKEAEQVIGDVAGKTCIMIDDILSLGHTLTKAAHVLDRAGAKEIYACVSHGLFAGNAIALVNEAPFKELLITDSVYVEHPELIERLKFCTCSELMGEGIKRIHEKLPMSPLFII